MTTDTARAIYDRLIPTWREAPLRSGNRRVRCPLHDDRDPSLDIHEGKGVWVCRAGCGNGGAWDLARAKLGEAEARTLFRELGGYDGTPHGGAPPVTRSSDNLAGPQLTRWIERTWTDTIADDGTIARYVRTRGLIGAIPPTLRLHRALSYWDVGPDGSRHRTGKHPAMVARVQTLDDTVVALHRTYLAADGAGKAPVSTPKKLSPAIYDGATNGAAIHLAEPFSQCVALTEGIETGLAVMEATGMPTWACVSAGGLAAVVLPPEIRTVDVWVDHDRAGLEAAEKLSGRLLAEGRTVRHLIPPRPGDDWLDVFVQAGAEALHQAQDTTAACPPSAVADTARLTCVQTDGWADPVPFHAPLYGPPVPLDAFPQAIAAYVADVSAAMQVPADFVATGALGVMAAAGAQRALVGIGQSHTEPLNLYLAPVMESGERKQSIRHVLFPLQDEQHALADGALPTIKEATQSRQFLERRIEELQRKAARSDDAEERQTMLKEAIALENELPQVPPLPQLIFDDITPEQLGRVLTEQHGRAAIISEEAGTLFEILAGRYSAGKQPQLDVVLKAYDGGMIDTGRVTRGRDYVRRPALTVLVTPQPILLDRMRAQPELRGRGVLARFGFTMPASLVGTRRYLDRAIDDKARRQYARAIQGVLALPLTPQDQEPPWLLIRGEALHIWREHADAVELMQADGGALNHLRDWASKSAGRVARIAGLFHLAEGRHVTEPITPATIANAWKVGAWLQAHALVAFARIEEPAHYPLAKWIVAWVQRHGLTGFTESGLHKHKRLRPGAYDDALAELGRRNLIRRVEQPERTRKPGRPPSQRYEVHPEMSSLNSGNPSGSGFSEFTERFSETVIAAEPETAGTGLPMPTAVNKRTAANGETDSYDL